MFLRRLRQRNLQPELMDDPALEPAEHRRALRALQRINWWSRSAAMLWKPLARLAQEIAPRPLRMLDVATGAGDMPRQLARWAARAGLAFEIAACDISAVALAHARELCQQDQANIHFFRRDVLAEGLPTGYDAITSSLFLHHLTNVQAVRLLTSMREAAGRLVLVNDLRRCRTGYVLAWLGCRILTRSPVARVDGPRSVEGAFTTDELLELAKAAGMHGAKTGRRWPCRYLLQWSRPEKMIPSR